MTADDVSAVNCRGWRKSERFIPQPKMLDDTVVRMIAHGIAVAALVASSLMCKVESNTPGVGDRLIDLLGQYRKLKRTDHPQRCEEAQNKRIAIGPARYCTKLVSPRNNLKGKKTSTHRSGSYQRHTTQSS